MKRSLRTFLSILLISLSFLPVFAQENQEKADYSIEGLQKSNQINENAGYFHLKVNENTQERLEILVHNNSDQKASFAIDFNLARTNENGLIVYQKEQAWGPNASLPYNIEDFITISDPIISVEARKTKAFQIDLKFENVKFTGILLGAFRVQKIEQSEDQSGLGQEYLYELGLILSQDDTADLPNSQNLSLGKVEFKLKTGHKVLEYQIINQEANIARNLNLQTRLYYKDAKKYLFNENKAGLSIAPNGVLVQNLDWQRQDLEAGSYQLELAVSDGQNSWLWQYDFELAEAQAAGLNDQADRKIRYPSWLLNIFIILAILTLINTTYLVYRRNKNLKSEFEGGKV